MFIARFDIQNSPWVVSKPPLGEARPCLPSRTPGCFKVSMKARNWPSVETSSQQIEQIVSYFVPLLHHLFFSFTSLNHSESDSTHCNPQPPQPSFQSKPSYAMSKTIWCQNSLCSIGSGKGGTLSGPAVWEPSKRMGPTEPCSDLTANFEQEVLGCWRLFLPTWFLNCEMCSLENQPRCSMKMYSERVLTMWTSLT